jgi:hypothetical protein
METISTSESTKHVLFASQLSSQFIRSPAIGIPSMPRLSMAGWARLGPAALMLIDMLGITHLVDVQKGTSF